MGFLDNDTIVVDAILTKHGRRILADNGTISPSHFALSDDGTDYSLWNKSSSSGSSGYDDYISSLPLIEAVPDDSVMMKYKLLSLDRNTEYMPIITWPNDTTSFTLSNTNEAVTLNPMIDQFAAGAETFLYRFSDISPLQIINMGGGTMVDLAGSAIDFPQQQNIATYVEIINVTGPVEIGGVNVTAHTKVFITVEGQNSGATSNVDISVEKP